MHIRFLLQCAGWSLPILTGTLLFVGLYWDSFPAPRLTANIAVNEQVDRLARSSSHRLDVLAVGSSMTLNNLATGPVLEHFGTTHYENAAAWGIGAQELELYAPLFIRHFRPDQVIVVTNMMDMQRGSPLGTEDTVAIGRHLRSGGGVLPYLRHWNSPYYLRQMRTNRIRFNDPSNYEFLGYDAHGGSTLEVPEALIDRTRFNEPPPLMADLDAGRMAAFARFARYLRTNNVDLLVLCSPYRDGLRTPDNDREAQAFVTMLENVLRPMGHKLVNGYEAQWSDDLYCDASHFDHAGAETFTRWCLSRAE